MTSKVGVVCSTAPLSQCSLRVIQVRAVWTLFLYDVMETDGTGAFLTKKQIMFSHYHHNASEEDRVSKR